MRNDDPVMKAIILLAASILSIILTLAGCVIAPASDGCGSSCS